MVNLFTLYMNCVKQTMTNNFHDCIKIRSFMIILIIVILRKCVGNDAVETYVKHMNK